MGTERIIVKELIQAVYNDVYAEGVYGNCRWMYSPFSNKEAPGVLSLATASNFDRWSNSRIVTLHPALFDRGDTSYHKVVLAIIESL